MAICDCPLKPFCIGESPQLQPSWYGTLWPHLTHALPARLMLSLQAEMYMQSADCIAFLLRIQGVIGIASLSSVWLTMHVVLGGLAAAALAAHDTVVFGLLELRSAHSSTFNHVLQATSCVHLILSNRPQSDTQACKTFNGKSI